MHDAHELDLGVRRQVAIDLAGIDRVVIGDLELVQLRAVVAQPVAHVAPEHAGHDVEARGARLHETARRRLEPQDRLALHEQDVLARAVQLADLALGAPEGLEECRVVVVGDRCGLGSEDAGPRHRGAGAQGEVGLTHRILQMWAIH